MLVDSKGSRNPADRPIAANDVARAFKGTNATGVRPVLDTLAGIFGIGQKPSGTKDPFALRRASIAVLRLLVEKNLYTLLKRKHFILS